MFNTGILEFCARSFAIQHKVLGIFVGILSSVIGTHDLCTGFMGLQHKMSGVLCGIVLYFACLERIGVVGVRAYLTTLFTHFVVDDHICIVTEYLSGGDLRHLLLGDESKGTGGQPLPLSWAFRVRIMRDLMACITLWPPARKIASPSS